MYVFVANIFFLFVFTHVIYFFYFLLIFLQPSNGNVVDGVSKLKKNCQFVLFSVHFLSCFEKFLFSNTLYTFFLFIGYTDVGPSSPKLVSSSRNPLGDISNSKSLRKGCLKKSVSIGLPNSTDLENKYAPNSISPSPMPRYSIYFSQKFRFFSFLMFHLLLFFAYLLFILIFYYDFLCFQSAGSVKSVACQIQV